MEPSLQRTVRERAHHLCEYCGLPENRSKLPFVLDHIIASQHGGQTTVENLALCCGFCNRHKGPNLAGIDPKTGELTRLFHPRKDRWRVHFRRHGATIVGLTPVGRATVRVLAMNHTVQLIVRRALIAEGISPSS